eukprot:CAMPEP_0185353618 /NCGR_PEP_ID=MMETSP1364-20130426/4667_1 /TAXON_ID=38817 /ORGANISM="Gephyrocapsa oceanica, Strain RCC1303" /LENGTH=62 /DNA_ID=CAMNT_0027953247 /DNA_START=189 /DNA_END=374 /DNA_ORIENTATION=+
MSPAHHLTLKKPSARSAAAGEGGGGAEVAARHYQLISGESRANLGRISCRGRRAPPSARRRG